MQLEVPGTLLVVAGLPAIGKTTLVARISQFLEVRLVPEKMQWMVPPEIGEPENSASALEVQRFHLNVDQERSGIARQLQQLGGITLCISDFTSTLAYCYAAARTTGDSSLYDWSVATYVSELKQGRVVTGDCYLYLRADESIRARWRDQDAVRQPRSDLFFDPAFAGAMEDFYTLVFSEHEDVGALLAICCHTPLDLTDPRRYTDGALQRVRDTSIAFDYQAFSDRLHRIHPCGALTRYPSYDAREATTR